MKLVFYVILIVILCCYDTNASEVEFRSKSFARSTKESALVGHVIKTTQAADDMECLIQCNQELPCLSYNYKNSPGGLPVCQMNKQTATSKPGDLLDAKGFHYYGPIESLCLKTNPCENGGTCQQELNHATKTYKCLCHAEYSGPNCDTLATDPSSNFDIFFPRRNSTNYVTLQKMPQLTGFTISLTVNLIENGSLAFISYATTEEDNAMSFYQRYSVYGLHVMGYYLKVKDDAGVAVPPINADGMWHHLVLTWENVTGKTQFYIDGVLKHSHSGFATGTTILGNGMFVLGNEQDSYNGGFESQDALVGSISRVNVWDKVLPTDTITTLLRSCGNEVGTAVAWKDFRPNATKYYGDAALMELSSCT